MIEKFIVDKSLKDLGSITNYGRQEIIKQIPIKFEPIQKEILCFINTLEKDKKIDLNNLYRNLKTLSINKNNFILKIKKARGAYDILHNEIILEEKDVFEDVLFHELLHMASSTYFPSEKIALCGTGQLDLNKFRMILGLSLNEGYTELLNLRYFPKLFETVYTAEQKVAWAVEQIVGVEAMYNYYFNANLLGLAQNLAQYTTDEASILLFLRKIIRGKENKNIKKFLINIYNQKLQIDLSHSIITEDEFVEKIAFFIYTLGYKECESILNNSYNSSVLKKLDEIKIDEQNKRFKLVREIFK